MRKVDPVKYDEKRREILEAAGRCFVRDGFHGTSTSAICAEAGISPGHLYHYFASKEAIIEAMAVANLGRAAERFSQLAESSNVVTALLSEIELHKSHRKREPRECRAKRSFENELAVNGHVGSAIHC